MTICYTVFMMKINLSIEEVQSIMKWSYPKTLAYAKKYGNLHTPEVARGKWFILSVIVKAELDRQVVELQDKQAKYITVIKNTG